MPDHLNVQSVGEVANPARHEVEDAFAGFEQRRVEPGERRDCCVINMRDEARRRVEVEVGTAVLLGESS